MQPANVMIGTEAANQLFFYSIIPQTTYYLFKGNNPPLGNMGF